MRVASKVNFNCLKIGKIFQWCNKWKMRINRQESNVVHLKKPFLDNYLNIVSGYKYLRLILDEHMTFEKAGRALESVINKLKSSLKAA